MTLQRAAHISMIIIAFLLLASTAVSMTSRPITVKDVHQYVDQDGGVVCYILQNGGGISCLPMDEVKEINEDE